MVTSFWVNKACVSLPLSIFSMYFSSHLNPLKCNLRFFFQMYVIRLHRIMISCWRYKKRKEHGGGSKKKYLEM